MKIALVFVTLLASVFAIWHHDTRDAARSREELARVLRLDPRKVEPSTRALVLLETIPHLREPERDAAVQRLRSTLETIPRGFLLHTPSFPVETIRFSGDGTALLWYGRTKDGGFTVEKWSRPAPVLQRWTPEASNATFTDRAGLEIFTDEAPGAGPVISRDGAYLALVGRGFLFIWRVRDFARGSGRYPAFLAEVPHATTRLHCVASEELCGVEGPGRFTLVDVKGHRVLRSIPVDRTARVHLSPGGRLVGVAGRRTGITLHGARDGRKVRIDTSSLALEDFAFSADEKSVVVLDRDGGLHAYDAATGKPKGRSAVLGQEQWKSPAHIETVGDGRFVVWGGAKVRLVSADLATVHARFDEGGEVAVVETSARGDRLAIARRGGPLTLWDVSTKMALPLSAEELVASACAHVGRPLTAQEWAAYIPDRKYEPGCL